jgi:hypothetical protein
MPDFDSAASFLAGLAHGTLIGGHYDPPRQWTPRIVPSTKAI